MISIAVTDAWKVAHAGAFIGILEVSQVDNTVACFELNERKRALEVSLRARYQGFTRSDFVSLPVLSDYVRYCKSFDKTYHVLLQLESIALKGKTFPNVSPLVDANFVSEVQTLVVTAGHDVANLRAPVCIDVSRAGEGIVQMGGSTKSMPAGDMVMRDTAGLTCSIIYGQDNRSPITSRTTHALYVTYAPTGVSETAVSSQLQGILDYIRTFAPHCIVEQQTLLKAQ